MKLQIKLGLPLIVGLFIIIMVSMGWLFISVSDSFTTFATSNNENLKALQIEDAEKLFSSTNAVLHKKIKMGNKRGLKVILSKQNRVKGVEEVSVFNNTGQVIYSSKEDFLGRQINLDALSRLQNKKSLTLWTDKGVEIYDPQIITRKCTMCHIHRDWRGEEGSLGGITYFRASTEAFKKTKRENDIAITEMKQSFTKFIILSMTAILLTSAGLIIVLVKKLISKPLKSTLIMFQDIAEGEGDLTKRLEIKSQDEIGELSKWFNVFIEKLHGMIKDISGSVKTLSSSSTDLSAISEQMTQGITNVTERATILSAAAEEMSANMNDVATTMEQSATKTDMVAKASEQMSITIEEIAINSEKAHNISDKAAKEAADVSTNIDQLGAAADSIGKIVGTITEISEQVNLLSLNATIEAARAGEAGKGFAVVANEIKELAKQTAEATQDIKRDIEGIQGTTSMTVNHINEISTVIDSVNTIVESIATTVEQQTEATRKIASNVSEVSTGIQGVSENVIQSSSVSKEISGDMNQVSMSMSEMATSSSQVNLSAKELFKLSESLKKMVYQFKI